MMCVFVAFARAVRGCFVGVFANTVGNQKRTQRDQHYPNNPTN